MNLCYVTCWRLPEGAGANACWTLIVADNNSHDASVPSLRQIAPVVEMGRNAGYAAGINAAIGGPELDAFVA